MATTDIINLYDVFEETYSRRMDKFISELKINVIEILVNIKKGKSDMEILSLPSHKYDWLYKHPSWKEILCKGLMDILKQKFTGFTLYTKKNLYNDRVYVILTIQKGED